jgi:inhibitor of KinA sporulation pathway (predicted exonuclease)
MIRVFLDLEMNQPSGSIIQIGAVAMNMKNGRVNVLFKMPVNPKETIAPEITTLTGITQKDVDEAPTLEVALTKFWAWAPSHSIAAWGTDCDLVLAETRRLNVPTYGRVHIHNVKEMASDLRCAFPSHKARGGLVPTMELFGLKFEGRHHDALDDAMNTARLAYHFVRIVARFHDIQKAVVL